MELAMLIVGAIIKLGQVGYETYEASQEKQEELKRRVMEIMIELKHKIDNLPAQLAAQDARHDQSLKEKFAALDKMAAIAADPNAKP